MASRLAARIHGRYQRTVSKYLFRRPFVIDTPAPMVSFTFDDFPRSALVTGGAILRRFGVAGTYFASLGLMGTRGPTGEIFVPDDLGILYEQGHELGCHTFGHLDSWETDSDLFERSVVENAEALRAYSPCKSFESFSYPISPPRPWTKRTVAKHFKCCRAGGQTLNVGRADLNQLAAFFLEQSRGDPGQVRELIDRNRRARGWLILATHDVCEDPTPFGCTPRFFEIIVQLAIDSGAQVLTMIDALGVLKRPVRDG